MATAAGNRLRRVLRRHGDAGFLRVVFARPREEASTDPEERVFAAAEPGSDGQPPPTTESLLEFAERAVDAGFVKITIVVDEATRVRVDARHGRAKTVKASAERLDKMMGGKAKTLRPDTSAAVLRAIGIMNADGSISANRAKKYKQVNHLVEQCRPLIARLAAQRQPSGEDPLRIADLACGNSYLSFVLLEALRLDGIPARLWGIDARSDVVERSRQRARELGYDECEFSLGRLEEVDLAARFHDRLDLAIALHACDTATDHALAKALRAGARAILLAPCCQRELAEQLDASALPFAAIGRQGLLARDYAAVVTDAIRVELLQAWGYRVDVLEFVGAEHSLKNLLIRAIKIRRAMPERVATLVEQLSHAKLSPCGLLHVLDPAAT